METIVKVLKAFFLGADGEVDVTTLQKFKRCLLWVVLGAGLTIGLLFWWAGSDEDAAADEDEIEYVYYDENGNEISEEEYYELGGE